MDHRVYIYTAIPLAVGLFVSAALAIFLCVKHKRRKLTPPAVAPSLEAGGVKGSDTRTEDAAVWKKAILMGEKCSPPEFSGAIYYDYDGNRVPELPRSPRVAAASPDRSFSFMVEKIDGEIH